MRIREVTALRVSQGHGPVGLRAGVTASVRAWHVARSFMQGGRAPVLAPAPPPKPILAYHSSTRGGTGFRHGSPAPTPVAASGTHTGTEGWPASSATACSLPRNYITARELAPAHAASRRLYAGGRTKQSALGERGPAVGSGGQPL